MAENQQDRGSYERLIRAVGNLEGATQGLASRMQTLEGKLDPLSGIAMSVSGFKEAVNVLTIIVQKHQEEDHAYHAATDGQLMDLNLWRSKMMGMAIGAGVIIAVVSSLMNFLFRMFLG